MLLREAYPAFMTDGGVFADLLEYDPTITWMTENDAVPLALEYYLNRSGGKIVSPLVDTISDGEVLTETDRAVIAAAILAVNGRNFSELFATLNYEYNPIENYSMTETTTPGVKVTVTESRAVDMKTERARDEKTERAMDEKTSVARDEKTATNSDVTEKTNSDITASRNAETTDGIFGFNSSSSVNATSHSEDAEDNYTQTTGDAEDNYTQTVADEESNYTRTTGSENNNYSHTVGNAASNYDRMIAAATGNFDRTTGDAENNVTETETEKTGSDVLTRSGNIGVTTSQQMIESQREMWKWNFYREVVFPELDRALVLAVY